MYTMSDSYEAVSALISGYFLGLDTVLKMDLNAQFRDWIVLKAKKPTAYWSEGILRVMAENDEVRAREILFAELNAFLENI